MVRARARRAKVVSPFVAGQVVEVLRAGELKRFEVAWIWPDGDLHCRPVSAEDGLIDWDAGHEVVRPGEVLSR